MTSTTIQLAQRGIITIPKELRDANNMKEGDVLTIMDIGGGSLLIMPGPSKLDKLSESFRGKMNLAGVTLEDLLAEARNVRDGK